jgi:putative MFS transporter
MGRLLADRIGRKPMFTIDLAIFPAGLARQYFVVTSASCLRCASRRRALPSSADYAVGWPMLAEFAPANPRIADVGREIGWYAGYLAAYALAWALTVHFAVDWRFVLLSAVPTLIVLLMLQLWNRRAG